MYKCKKLEETDVGMFAVNIFLFAVVYVVGVTIFD